MTTETSPAARTTQRRKIPSGASRMKAKNAASATANCQAAVQLIADYLSANLTPAVHDACENHLSACKDCRAFFNTYKKTIDLTRAFFQHQPAPRRQFTSVLALLCKNHVLR